MFHGSSFQNKYHEISCLGCWIGVWISLIKSDADKQSANNRVGLSEPYDYMIELQTATRWEAPLWMDTKGWISLSERM